MVKSSTAASARLIALIVACAMFMAQLDGAVVTLILPDMARSFGTTTLSATTGITTYLLVQVLLLPTSSWTADRFGSRRVFAIAMIAFTVASVLCGLSHSLPQFVAARILQGAAAALMTPVGRVLMLHTTDKSDLVRVMSISTIPMLVAPSVGPLVGGYIAHYWSWPWIFLINVPFGIAGVLLTLRFIPNTDLPKRRPFDAVGYVLFAGASALVLYALSLLGTDALNWEKPTLLFVVGCGFGLAAARHERRTPHPIISLAALRIRTYAITTVYGGSVVRLPVRALSFLLPVMFQLTLGMSVIQAGALQLALNGGDLVLKTVTNRTIRHFGFRSVILASTAVVAIMMLLCAGFSNSTSVVVIALVLLGAGMGRSLLFTGISTLALADVPREQLSDSSVLWNIIQQATTGLGVSLSAILLAFSSRLSDEPAGALSLHDFRFTLLVWAVIACASLLSFGRLPLDAGGSVSGHRPALAGQ